MYIYTYKNIYMYIDIYMYQIAFTVYPVVYIYHISYTICLDWPSKWSHTLCLGH